MANANKMAQEIYNLDFLPQIKAGPESLRSIQKFAKTAANEISKVMNQIGQASFSDKDAQQMASKMKDIGQKLVQARQEGNKEVEAGIQDQFALEKKNLEVLLQRRKEGTKFVEGALTKPEGAADVGETIGKGIGAAFSDILSGDIGNIGDMLKRWGSRTKKAGFAMQAKETEGSAKGIMGILGKTLRKLGPILLVVGAIAAAFTAIVKTVISADTKMKELNKTLIDSGASVGDITTGTRNLVGYLGGIAKFAQDQSFNKLWGTLPEEQAQLLGAWSEAGFTLKEMRTQIKGAATNQQAYQKATAAALTYSKLLGESATTVASGMAERMEDLGLSLEGVREQYASVYDAAQLSGFGTKRFFGMVLQATSGMSMFNVRMEEAAGLMLGFTKILGAKTGEQFFQTLTAGFKGMSHQDRIKAVKMMGGAYKEIAASEMTKAGTDVMGKLSSDFGKDFNRGGEALAAFGMEMGMSQNLLKKIAAGGPAGRAAQKQLGDMLAKQMVNLSPEKYTEALAVAKLHIEDPKLLTEIEKLYRTTRGMSDDIVDQARATASWGPGGVMAGHMAIAFAKANKPIHLVEENIYLGIQEMLRLDDDAMEQMSSMSRSIYGGFDALDKAQKKASAAGRSVTVAENKILAKTYRMAIKDGQKYTAEIGKKGNVVFKDAIDNVQDAVLAMGGTTADAKDAAADQQRTALVVAEKTLTFERQVQQYMEQVLGDISRTVTDIKAALTGGLNKKERDNQQEMVTLLKNQEKELELQKKGKTAEEQAVLEREKRATRLIRTRLNKEESVRGGVFSNKERDELKESVVEDLVGALKRPTVSVMASIAGAKYGVIPKPSKAPVVGAEQFDIMRDIASGMFTKAEVDKVMLQAKTAAFEFKAAEKAKAAERLGGATPEGQARVMAHIGEKSLVEARRVASEEFFKMFKEKGVEKFLEEASKSATEGSVQKARIDSEKSLEKLFGPQAALSGPPIKIDIFGNEEAAYRGTTNAINNLEMLG